MDYIEVNCIVNAPNEYVEIVIARLSEEGFEMFEETEGGVKAYIPAGQFAENYIDLFSDLFNNGVNLKFSHRLIPAQNWNSVWESNFEPVIIGKKVYVRADFHPSMPSFEYEIVIQPKMAFGTGHHSTTSLVMQQMLDLDMNGKNVLDMGCGTGILAILGSRLGAAKIVAIDNDPVAVTNTIENAAQNNCINISAQHGDASDLNGMQFDVILANINRNIILNDLSAYASSLMQDGIIVFSGFYTGDAAVISKEAEKNELKLINSMDHDQWCCLTFKKSK